jgi:hypothetical protein
MLLLQTEKVTDMLMLCPKLLLLPLVLLLLLCSR